jgi:hypothetical protein
MGSKRTAAEALRAHHHNTGLDALHLEPHAVSQAPRRRRPSAVCARGVAGEFFWRVSFGWRGGRDVTGGGRITPMRLPS